MEIANYKFNIGERVKIKNIDRKGEVLDRNFPFSKGLISFIPGKYYTVMVQDEEYMMVDDKKMYLNLVKVEYREKNLEKIIKGKYNK